MPPPRPPASASFLQALSQCKRPLALAGAGLSAASGIPTFRGSNGLWRNHDPLSLATPQAFSADPNKVWQFYHWRRELCLRAKPNKAHRVVSALGSRLKSAQWDRGLRLVTQNVDGLSRRANADAGQGVEEEPLEMRVLVTSVAPGGGNEIDPKPLSIFTPRHGSLFRTICTKCHETKSNFDSPICESLRGTETTHTDNNTPLKPIPLSDLPRCQRSNCGGLLRPGVVWFGESIPLLDDIEMLLAECDMLLVLGTSSTAYPAAGFADRVWANGGTVAVFNTERSGEEETHSERWFFFHGAVEETLAEAVGYDGS